jgi:hypothetical protein
MRTRYLTCAYIGGEYKIAQYGQADGYPEGAGANILRFLSSVKIDVLKSAIQECEWYTDDEIKEIEKENEDMKKTLPGWDWTRFYPELSRTTGAKILQLILLDKKRKLENRISFASESLNCEWAYIIDFDKETLEVYSGFNKTPLEKEDRFYSFPPHVLRDGTLVYQPVKIVASFPLWNLPDEDSFVEGFNKKDDVE